MKNKILIAAILPVLFLAGCSIKVNTNGSAGGGNDGGIYKSTTKGNTWSQKTLIPTVSGKPSSFGAFDAYNITVDPTDSKAIYLGTIGEGLLFSYDGAETWQRAKALGRVTVRAVAIDPAFKCNIYVAVDNKVYKTNDCSRTFTQTYYDNDPNVRINSIVVDHRDPNNVLIGTTRGEIIKSMDRGNSWQTINRFSDRVLKILVSPHDSNIIFAATERSSLHLSRDAGKSWVSLEENLTEFKDSVNFKDMAFSGTDPGKIFLASRYGLLKSTNNGKSWVNIELITPEAKATINALAISPKNDQEIYYSTNTTFYRSLDGGQNWSTKKLPTTRVGWDLAVDYDDPSIIYMAVRAIE